MSDRPNANTMIRLLKPGEHADCERILRSLPNWFGIEKAIVQYVKDVQSMQTWVVEECGTLVGFLTLHRHNAFSAEVHVVAVAPSHHRQGIGRQLFEHAEQVLQSEAVEFLQVKTLAPSRPDPNYQKTREFYQSMGFRPLEENKLWGEENPCLIMIKHLGPSSR